MSAIPQSQSRATAIVDGVPYLLIQMTALILTATLASAVFSLGWRLAALLEPLLHL